MENSTTLALTILFALSVAAAFGYLSNVAFRKTPKLTDFDLKASADARKATRGEGWVERGQVLLISLVPPIAGLVVICLLQASLEAAGCMMVPLLFVFALTAFLILKGSAAVRTFAPPPPGYVPPEPPKVPDARAEALIREIAGSGPVSRGTPLTAELNRLLYELIELYDSSDGSLQTSIREAIGARYDFAEHFRQITAQETEKVQASSDPEAITQHLRRGVLAVAIDYADFREAFMALDPLQRAAKAAGFDLRDTFRDLANPSDPAFEHLTRLIMGRYADDPST